MEERIKLSDHFTYGRLFRFVLPSIIMMVFTSIYGVVDGLFVSNFAGKTAFAAVNLIMPFPMVLGTLGFMLGTGGTAVVSRAMGEGEDEKANRYFSMMVYTVIIGGIIFSVIGEIVLEPVAILMGADAEMLPYCVSYGRILLISVTCFMLQNVFQSFLVTAEKPKLGLIVTIIAGLTNMLLDFIFVGLLKGGVVGAGAATAITESLGGIIPLIYFLRKNDSRLRLVPTKIDFRILGKASFNGLSELLTNVSMSLVNILYNYQLMRLSGQDGVAAYGMIMYVSFIFIAVLIGYSIGSAPIIGFNYGASNHDELHNMFTKSLKIVGVTGLIMFCAAMLLASPLSTVFVGYDAGLLALATRAFRLYSIAYLINGYNIFGSAFFTALGNGLISGTISFMRTLFFQVIAVLVLPMILGIDGIWLAITFAEACALVITITFLIRKRAKYNY